MAAAAARRWSLSGAGFLGAWHLGACDALLKANAITPACEIAGASAGALVGAVVVTGTPISVAREHLRTLVQRTRKSPLGVLTPGFSLVDQLRGALSADLPSDAHHLASGRLHVAMTSLRSHEFGQTRHQSQFGSRDELIAAVTASSDIPGLTGNLRNAAGMRSAAASATSEEEEMPSTALLLQRWLRRSDIDGGILDLFPDPWAAAATEPLPAAEPSGDAAVAFISPFAGVGFAIAPPRVLGAKTIPAWSPICASSNGRVLDLTAENVTRWRHAFLPPEDHVLQAYERAGYEAAQQWLSAHGLGARLGGSARVTDVT